jgi:hypothetical protein
MVIRPSSSRPDGGPDGMALPMTAFSLKGLLDTGRAALSTGE